MQPKKSSFSVTLQERRKIGTMQLERDGKLTLMENLSLFTLIILLNGRRRFSAFNPNN